MHKRLAAILLIASLLFSMAACAGEQTADTTLPATISSSTDSTAATESTGSDTVNKDYYAGKPEELLVTYKDYEYRYFSRDRLWEADIVYMVRTLLETHPLLKDQYSRVKGKNGDFAWINRNEYYDSELRKAVLNATQQLLDQIPELADYEITMEMERIVAMLSDVHTWLYTYDCAMLPISLEYMEKEGQVGLYVVWAPQEQPELLFCQMTAINGWPVEEVIELLRPYVGHENEYGLTAEIVEFRDLGTLINNFDALCAIGVADANAQSAAVTFVDHDSVEFTRELAAVDWYLAEDNAIKRDYYTNRIGLHARQIEENYWYEVWPEEDALYFRIASCMERTDYSMAACCQDILADLEAAQAPMRLVIDLRHNGGGYYPLDGVLELATAVNEMELDGVYILVDSHCFSATTYFAQQFRDYIEDAIFIGTPLGQSYGFFAASSQCALPNTGWVLAVSTMYTDRMPEFSGTTFMPDILCYPNWEDYQNEIDTVLNTALTME